MNELIKELKDNEQDFELYPTTKEITKAVYDHLRIQINTGFSILDIGCGTCNLKKHFEEFNSQFDDDDGKRLSFNYYVIEKSQILIDRLDKNTICLGTDFLQTTLLDKDVNVIFCNPPYSEYETWVKKILKESLATHIFLVIPSRWKDDEELNTLIIKKKEEQKSRFKEWSTFDYRILGSYDFLNAERKARAKVDLLYVHNLKNKNTQFDRFFEETFKFNEKNEKEGYQHASDKRENLKHELATGKNKVEFLVNAYNDDMSRLLRNFIAISQMDKTILEDIGVKYDSVKEALKSKLAGLKNIYWGILFDNLDDITKRLTRASRENLVCRFNSLKTIDFTLSNIYATLSWVCKNASDYYEKQLIDFFYTLSNQDSVVKYKSNQRVFKEMQWRSYLRDEVSHYTLDYRIVCSRSSFHNADALINVKDFVTIFENLGFKVGQITSWNTYGAKNYVHFVDGEVAMEYKVFKNGNLHIKFNIEFTKAMNVEVARLLGWIKNPADIKEEFPAEMANGAEIYFNKNLTIDLKNSNLKLLN